MNPPIDRRIDFAFYFDVSEGNPNGDPMRDNAPRVDPYDGHGIVTDVCLKRKVRDWLSDRGHEMFIGRDGVSLNEKLEGAAERAGAKGKKTDPALKRRRGEELCRTYLDVRLFGAMAETGDYPAGRITGPAQMSMARSLHPISFTSHQLTRVALTKADEVEKPGTMTREGGRHLIRYAAYRTLGTVTPTRAKATGLSSEDLALLFDALCLCWGRDRASARGVMGARGLYLAVHSTGDGRLHASDLYAQISHTADRPRSWDDVGLTLRTVDTPDVMWYRWSVGEGMVPIASKEGASV